MKKFVVINDKGEFLVDFAHAPIGRRIVTPIFEAFRESKDDYATILMVSEGQLDMLKSDLERHNIHYFLIPLDLQDRP